MLPGPGEGGNGAFGAALYGGIHGSDAVAAVGLLWPVRIRLAVFVSLFLTYLPHLSGRTLPSDLMLGVPNRSIHSTQPPTSTHHHIKEHTTA